MNPFSSEYPNGLMSVKSKSESIQNVTMFNIPYIYIFLESLDASCMQRFFNNSSVGTLSYD